MLTEIITAVLAAFIMVAIVINTLAIAFYIVCKSVDFMYSSTKDRIFAFAGKALSTVWKVAFLPAIWVFERL
jgi:hypothetical protein